MEIRCPHCGHAEQDLFELIEVNELHDDFLCTRCRQPFAAFIKNCIRCDFEQPMTWGADAVPDAVDALPCAQCGHISTPPTSSMASKLSLAASVKDGKLEFELVRLESGRALGVVRPAMCNGECRLDEAVP
jgi:hypothetical protein